MVPRLSSTWNPRALSTFCCPIYSTTVPSPRTPRTAALLPSASSAVSSYSHVGSLLVGCSVSFTGFPSCFGGKSVTNLSILFSCLQKLESVRSLLLHLPEWGVRKMDRCFGGWVILCNHLQSLVEHDRVHAPAPRRFRKPFAPSHWRTSLSVTMCSDTTAPERQR